MRIYINESHFLSVLLKTNNTYSCQIMELIHGFGMSKASIVDNQEDVVSSVVYENDIYSQTSIKIDNFDDVIKFHELCVFEYYRCIDEQNLNK